MTAEAKEITYVKAQVPDEERCLFTKRDGNRCKSAHLGSVTRLCILHEGRNEKADEAEVQAVSEFLMEKNVGLCTKDDGNRFTSQLLTLVSQKKVSRQDGSLLAYIASLLLQTITPVKAEEVAESREEFVESVAAPIREHRVMYPAHNAGPMAPEPPMPPMPTRKYHPHMNPGRWR
jgi:hypothetical protein